MTFGKLNLTIVPDDALGRNRKGLVQMGTISQGIGLITITIMVLWPPLAPTSLEVRPTSK